MLRTLAIVSTILWTQILFAVQIEPASMVFKSGGKADGSAWTLDTDGYVGAFLRLDQPGDVSVSVTASADAGRAHLNMVLADDRLGAHVEKSAIVSFTTHVPQGTYFLRIERSTDSKDLDHPLTIRDVKIDGAAVVQGDANVTSLAAANSYIEHFRRGPAVLKFPNVAPGTPIKIDLHRHAFNFGGNVHGGMNLPLVDPNAPPDSDPAKFQKFVRDHFTMVVVSNGGKWVFNEEKRGQITMQYVDAFFDFAKRNDLRTRMHTMLWDSPQQPEWVKSLIAAAHDKNNPTAAEKAKNDLRDAISKRIGYYVRDRAQNYAEADVLNELEHKTGFLNIFGVDGLADIFAEAAKARDAAGGSARLYLNEYNILQWSQTPPYNVDARPLDPYANWYRQIIQDIRAAGGPIEGVGVQYYIDSGERAKAKTPHSPARVYSTLQNLSVPGLPISLTEFGIKAGPTPQEVSQLMDDSMRLVFGTPQATTFLFFGFWEKAMWEQANAAVLVDANWNLTDAGRRYEQLMREWSTNLTQPLPEDRTIRFDGFFGEYQVQIGDRMQSFTLKKGTRDYSITQ